jgi:polymorphic membrane protein
MKNTLSLYNKKKFRLAQLASLLLLSLSLVATSSAAVYYVDDDSTAPISNGTSWATAYPSIQQAVDSAGDNGASESDPAQVWVAEGTYEGSGEYVVEMAEYVNLYGGFTGTETTRSQRNATTNRTIISGDSTQGGITGANNAVLDGFTITKLLGEYSGMYNYMTSPEISNCIFQNNHSLNDGAGMHNEASSPMISYCTFMNNKTEENGGAMYNYCSSPIISNCRFESNTAKMDGGGIYNFSCPAVVENSIFYRNIANNNGGAFYNIRSSPVITNCTIVYNQAELGPAVYTYNYLHYISPPIITSMSFPSITNCILISMGGQEVYSYNGYDSLSFSSVNYCCISHGYEGEGNFDANPMFWDIEKKDFRLPLITSQSEFFS